MSNGRAEVQIDAKQDLATTFSAQGHTTMSCVVNLFLPTICNIRSDLETLSIGGMGGSAARRPAEIASQNLGTILELSYLLEWSIKYARHIDSVTGCTVP